ncbi:MAG: acyl-CoA thioesterase [Acidobacteriota bacterium]
MAEEPDSNVLIRPIGESEAILTMPVLPADTNTYGNLFGGQMVAWIDKVASITAFRHARQNVVTASIDHLDFLAPVHLGDILTLRSALNYVGRSSMEVEVEVVTENRLTGATQQACRALLTFVAIDENERPSPVPRLDLQTDDERRRYQQGLERCQRRREAAREAQGESS